jgi:hypothetical protein
MSTACRSRQPGHVFLAYGRIQTVAHDAAIIPTDRRFSVRDSWALALGDLWSALGRLPVGGFAGAPGLVGDVGPQRRPEAVIRQRSVQVRIREFAATDELVLQFKSGEDG